MNTYSIKSKIKKQNHAVVVIQATTGEQRGEVCRELKKAIRRANRLLPGGLSFDLIYDISGIYSERESARVLPEDSTIQSL